MLNVAARNADPKLATSVVEVLSSRRTVISPFHYEALIAAYVGNCDLKTAFRVLCIMLKAGHEPDSSSTRPLFKYLSQSIHRVHQAWEALNALEKEQHVIPITAVNVIIESTIELAEYPEAVEFYKQLHRVVHTGPNTETYNTILRGAGRKDDGKELAMFMANEMRIFEIKPDQLTYDRIILSCLRDDDYEDAFRYLEEMEDVGKESVENGLKGWWMRKGTASSLVRRCIVNGDQRAWSLLETMEERGMNPTKLRHWADIQWGNRFPALAKINTDMSSRELGIK